MKALTDNTISIINSIRIITKDILVFYYALINSKEINEDMIKELKHNIELCHSLYESLGNNPADMQAILQYLNPPKALNYPSDDIDAILKGVDLVNYRITKNIAHILFSHPKVMINNTLLVHPYAYPVISISCSDIINSLIAILNQYINDDNLDEDKKHYLRKMLFYLLFVNPRVESSLIEQGFGINYEIEWHLTDVTEELGIDLVIAEAERRNIVGSIYNKWASYYLYNFDGQDKNLILFSQILLRMCLMFYGNERALEIRDKVLQDWHEKVYNEPTNILFSLGIKEIFSHLEEDKSRVIKGKKRAI